MLVIFKNVKNSKRDYVPVSFPSHNLSGEKLIYYFVRATQTILHGVAKFVSIMPSFLFIPPTKDWAGYVVGNFSRENEDGRQITLLGGVDRSLPT